MCILQSHACNERVERNFLFFKKSKKRVIKTINREEDSFCKNKKKLFFAFVSYTFFKTMRKKICEKRINKKLKAKANKR